MKALSSKQKIAAEISTLTRTGRSVLGRPVVIRKIPDEDSSNVGYTIEDSKVAYIYINFTNKLTESLSEDAARAFRKGVFAHELCHQLFTNFVYIGKLIDAQPSSPRKSLLQLYLNVVEDPAIEHFASTKFGGLLLKCLRFSVNYIWEQSSPLEEQDTALGQYIQALIMFGDRGLLKGDFTFPEAKKAFSMTVEDFYSAINEPNPKKRLKIAKKIFDDTQFLWEETVEEQEKLEELLKEFIQQATKISGSGVGEEPDENPEDARDEMRKSTIAKAMSSKSSESGDEGERSEASSASSGEDGSEEEEDGKSDEKSGGKPDKNSDDKSDEEGEKDKASASKPEEGSDETSGSDSRADTKDEVPAGKRVPDSGSSSGYDDSDSGVSWDFDNAEMEEIEKKIKAEVSEEAERLERVSAESVNDAPVIGGEGISGIGKLLNTVYQPTASDAENYTELLSKYTHSIKRVVNQLKSVLTQERESVRKEKSGKLNTSNIYFAGDRVTRMGKVTENLFLRRCIPDNSDMAVAVAIDMSGSTSAIIDRRNSASRIEVMRDCGIILAETFAALKIPIYIMGFDADRNGYDTCHHHFVRWKNTATERHTLCRCRALCNNRDGASIRYATRVLDAYEAKHKLLIVISDGQPAACNYGGNSGVADTKKAVAEAKQKFTVLGVACGADEGVLKTFYGGDFIVAKNGDDLLNGIVGKLKKLMR